ncbi:MAG: ATP synthase F1 subunit gamma [Candidatus Peribacteraceae bacterium]|nr:ATP synthase F1 subunit gamma [Candidatus Peribacteraceae bacterium]
MARSLRDLRRKMKAIKSTRQVTKAMELVAGSKMRRAVQNAEMLRHYALTSWRILQRIAVVHPGVHPYLAEKEVKNILAIFFSSDRGFCGSLNAQMFQAAERYVKGLGGIASFRNVDFVVAGRKGTHFLQRLGQKVIASFPALSNHPAFKDVLPIARMATEGFLNGTYDHIVLLYPDFVSPLVQDPAVKVVLPFSKSALKDMIGSLGIRHRGKTVDGDAAVPGHEVAEYKFEPSQEEVLKTILPQLTEMQIYQGVLEAAASEHSARMVAMHAATDNATDLLDDLTLTYNQTRQAKITAELSELSAAKAALD